MLLAVDSGASTVAKLVIGGSTTYSIYSDLIARFKIKPNKAGEAWVENETKAADSKKP